jgi:hypothetical protein
MRNSGFSSCCVAFALLCASDARAEDPPSANLCSKELDGRKFLAEGQSTGIVPCSNCNHADLGANEFYAPPSTACTCEFDSEKWLPHGWKFAKLIGEGEFSVETKVKSLVVTIAAGGGFRLQKVVAKADVPECGGTDGPSPPEGPSGATGAGGPQ